MTQRVGWERVVKVGDKGSAATAILESAVNIDIGSDDTFTDGTIRGNGAAVPKKVENLVQRGKTPTFSFHYDEDDVQQALLLTAYDDGEPVAILIQRSVSGDIEFDGDCFLEMTSPGELAGGMEVEVTCHPTRKGGRVWS